MILKCSLSLLLIFSSLTVLTREQLLDQRNLADFIIAKKLKSAPQNSNCSVHVNITSIQYETLSFDTREMQMTSRVKVNMMWRDPELSWNNTISSATAILLPVDKIWTPGLILDNAIDVTVKPYSNDVQVMSNGNVDHAVVLFIVVGCDINLFTYPFVKGECFVAMNGLSQKSCALKLFVQNRNVSLVSSNQGEWLTKTVSIKRDGNIANRKYLSVILSINPFGAVVTLILPSLLIMVADLVSFALPVQGGERNGLKVTLVLSFTMFLLILNEHLPSGGACSPVLHYHFCFCLITLVLSMVISIVFTRLASDDISLTKTPHYESKHNVDEERDTDVSETQCVGVASEMVSLQKIVNFLEDVDQKVKVKTSNETFVDRLDKIIFFALLFIYIIYIIIITVFVTKAEICKPEKNNFWDIENAPIYNSTNTITSNITTNNTTNNTIAGPNNSTTNITVNVTDNDYTNVGSWYNYVYYPTEYDDNV